MPKSGAPDITGLIRALNAGEPDAFNHLVDAAYPELHRIALEYLRSERPGHTLQSTALVNEAYLRLAERNRKDWKDRAHFFRFSARLMRGILVDYARARHAQKRGGSTPALTLCETDGSSSSPPVDILDLHSALEELATLDPFQARIVELRYFGGLSIHEIAEVSGASESTVKREWTIAKTWIRRRLLSGEPTP